MNHIGIDLGGRESQVCVRSEDAALVSERRMETAALAGLANLPKSRFVLETCAEAFAVATPLIRAGHDVRIVPATLVRTLGVGARGVKTDRRDARTLSEVSCRIDLPSVHVPSKESQELRSLLKLRHDLIKGRTMHVNAVRGYLRTQLVRPRRGTAATLPQRVREALCRAMGAVPAMVERQLKLLEFMNQQIDEADADLKRRAQTSETCRLLMTAPGVGPVIATRFMCAIDDPHRFPNARAVASYLGLTPGENSSSERQRRTGLTKAGPATLRSYLVQGGWTLLRRSAATPKSDSLKSWAHQVAQRRPRQVAVCALARKLSGILWAMWRDRTPYDPNRTHVAARRQEPEAV